MDERALSEGLFLLVGYLLTSARGLYDEPQDYGPFRLIEAAARLIEAMEEAGLSDPYLAQLRGKLDEVRFGSGQALQAVADCLSLEYAAELTRRFASLETVRRE